MVIRCVVCSRTYSKESFRKLAMFGFKELIEGYITELRKCRGCDKLTGLEHKSVECDYQKEVRELPELERIAIQSNKGRRTR